jgi:hypothetical protein
LSDGSLADQRPVALVEKLYAVELITRAFSWISSSRRTWFSSHLKIFTIVPMPPSLIGVMTPITALLPARTSACRQAGIPIEQNCTVGAFCDLRSYRFGADASPRIHRDHEDQRLGLTVPPSLLAPTSDR